MPTDRERSRTADPPQFSTPRSESNHKITSGELVPPMTRELKSTFVDRGPVNRDVILLPFSGGWMNI